MIVKKFLRRVVKIKNKFGYGYGNNAINSHGLPNDIFEGKGITVMRRCEIDRNSKIQSYTYIGNNCFISAANIGKYCSIANNVSIGMGEHLLSHPSTNSLFYDNPMEILLKNECIINNDVWIGVDSIIRRGVVIGNGAVIGANSFVNTNIPPYAIAVGSPAKVIKYRFTPEQIRLIEETKWWEKDQKDAKKILEGLDEILF